MEKFTKYRDRGTGLNPFFPILHKPTIIARLITLVLLPIRLLIFLLYLIPYAILSHLSFLPAFLSHSLNATLLFTLGVFWTDLQIEGVRRGALNSAPPNKYPRVGSIIACTLTSPIEPLYLAAVFNPVFTISYPAHRLVKEASIFQVISHLLSAPQEKPESLDGLMSLASLQTKYPRRIIAVFPECTTTNGSAVLPLSPSIVSSRNESLIFPLTVKYQPSNVVTPLPCDKWRFLFRAFRHLGIRMHVRIAESVVNVTEGENRYSAENIGYDEKELIAQVADGMARIGRVKKVGLMLGQKAAFITAYQNQ